jgi:hypothetical protein
MDLLNTMFHGIEVLLLALGLYFALRRFGLRRAARTFLRVKIDATAIKEVGNLLLVSIVVGLENRGQTRISARTRRDIKRRSDFLYDDRWDRCRHAGTFKIRRVLDKPGQIVFDWYLLPPIDKASFPGGSGGHQEADFEQINYLLEYQDPKTMFRDVDFWLEPNEIYEHQIMVWLPPGTYAMKAYFLGRVIKYREDEYWSCTKLFDFRKPKGNVSNVNASPVAV